MKTALLAVAGLALAASVSFGQANSASKPSPVKADSLTFNGANGEGPADQAKLAQERAAEVRDQALQNSQSDGAQVARRSESASPVKFVPAGTSIVMVTATAGTVGPTGYFDLKSAFDAINAGTHQGAVTVEISGNTSETAPCVLNSSGAGSASYTSVLVRPTSDMASVSGATATGRGLIELNGADNVTIDGDNPNSAGINRNLTITNTAANTVTYTSVIRVALAATVVTSADNNVIKNLNLNGSATGRNISTATSSTGSENTTYGIVATGGASTVAATTAPSALASVSTTIGTGATATNLLIDNNRIQTAARGVAVQGSSTAVFPGLTISNNVIGNPIAAAVDQVYSIGITAQGSANGTISLNTVYVEGFVPASSSAANQGIDVGGVSANGVFVINRNMVNRVKNSNPGFWVAHGINLAAGSGQIVRNNFVSNVIADSGTGGFYSTTFNGAGIRVAAGLNHQIYHNSVNMTGTITGTTAEISAAFMITASSLTGIDARNNIFVNTQISSVATSALVSANLPSGGSSAMNLTLNNNDYWNGAAPAANNGVGQVGTTSGTGFYTQANFDPTMTSPPANFRSYTSTLSAAGTNDNATKAQDPQYMSAADLHIAVASPMVDMGASVGVLQDIDGQNRVGVPDIGADEPSGVTPPANDIATTAINNPAPGSTISSASITPKASFQNVGTAAQTGVMVQFTITGPMGYSYSDTQTIASIAPSQTVMVTFAATGAFTNAGSYSMTASAVTPDANPANDSVSGMFSTVAPLVGGSYNVPGDYPSLTNAGGIFQAINAAGTTGNLTINITTDLTSETGANALNQIAGAFNVLIKPTGAAHTISGTGTALALIKLNGADNVTIDGSLTAGTDRSLTLTFGNASGVVVWIASASASDGANNNTVKNCIISGNSGVTVISGILTGSGTTLGGDAEAANSNNTIMNNAIFRAQNACFLRGAPLPNFDQNWLVTGNNFGSAVAADKLTFRGMLIGNAVNFAVRLNTISGLASIATSTSAITGIQVAIATSGGVVERNMVTDVKQTNPGTYAAYGIDVNNGTNVVVRNNFVSDINHDMSGGLSFSPSFGVFGILVDAGTGHQIYANSVNLFGVQPGTPNSSLLTAAFGVSSTAATGVDARDNIFANNITGGTTSIAHVAVYLPSGGTSAMNLTENNNSYYNGTDTARQGVGQAGTTAGTNFFVTLPMLKAYSATLSPAGTNDNASLASTGAVPYASNTDLHITNAAPEANMGVPLSGVTIDIDGQMRDPTTPDIGADEVTPAAPLTATSAVSRKVHGGSGTFDILLSLTGPPGIECRSGGGTSDYEVVITFSNNVVSGTATVTPGAGGTAMVNGAPTFSANTMTIELTGVSDVQQLTVNAMNVTDQFMQVLPNTAVPMKVLIGDVNPSSSVNGSDVALVKSQSGMPVTMANFRADVVPNGGSIGSSDIAITKSKSGNTLP